jgi:hypothetical protein
VFQGLWHGPPLERVLHACLQSFIEQGHIFHLYVYEHVDVPPAVVLMDANEVIPFDEVFYYRDPTTGRQDLGPFSDLFRYRLLHRRGEWWVDVDTVCLSSEIPQVDSAWAREFPEYSPAELGTSSIALREGSDLAKMLYEQCLELSRSGYKNRESLGPDLLSRVIGECGLPRDNFGSPALFYPIRWIEAFKLWLPQFLDEVSTKAAGAHFVALWRSAARYQGVDLSKAPPAGSYLDQVCERFGTDMADGLRQDGATVLSNVRSFFVKTGWAVDALRTVVDGEDTLLKLGVD